MLALNSFIWRYCYSELQIDVLTYKVNTLYFQAFLYADNTQHTCENHSLKLTCALLAEIIKMVLKTLVGVSAPAASFSTHH